MPDMDGLPKHRFTKLLRSVHRRVAQCVRRRFIPKKLRRLLRLSGWDERRLSEDGNQVSERSTFVNESLIPGEASISVIQSGAVLSDNQRDRDLTSSTENVFRLQFSPIDRQSDLRFHDILRSVAVGYLNHFVENAETGVEQQMQDQVRLWYQRHSVGEHFAHRRVHLSSISVDHMLFNSIESPHETDSTPVLMQSKKLVSYFNNLQIVDHFGNVPKRLMQVASMPQAPLEVALAHSWSPTDHSDNIFVHPDYPFTFQRQVVPLSTDCIRTKQGYSRGIHIFQVWWSRYQRGVPAVIGVGTSEAALHCEGYRPLVGANDQSWGWDISRCVHVHTGSAAGNSTNVQPDLDELENMRKHDTNYPDFGLLESNHTNIVVPDRFFMVLDCDEGTLSFVINNRFLGVAFRGLRGRTLYPMVSAVWGYGEVTMRYYNGIDDPLSLRNLCRVRLRDHFGPGRLFQMDSLPLPETIIDYLLGRASHTTTSRSLGEPHAVVV